ncbi:MAG: hypothetical protein WEF50_02225 [Myxococcota bacterium]
MRQRSASALGLALLVAGATLAARADEPKPAKPAPWSCTRPQVPPLASNPSPRDQHDQTLRFRLREIECKMDALKHLQPDGQETCYFGPEYARISNQRYEEIRQEFKHDPVELWHALLREPEDPNLPPLEIRVTSKSGPNCKSDADRKLEAEASALQKELNFR